MLTFMHRDGIIKMWFKNTNKKEVIYLKLNILKDTIKEKGFRLDFIAKQLKLSTYGFSLKLNGKNEFKWSEIEKIVELLKLDEKEKKKIFFN